jgi:hypothetical protein
MRWRIYYDDGSTFSDEDGGPDEAPALGVQIITVADSSLDPDNTGRRVWDGRDYYWWTDSEWVGGDLFGFYDYLARPGWKRVLFGRTIPARTYIEVRRRALSDPDFPRYSGSERP